MKHDSDMHKSCHIRLYNHVRHFGKSDYKGLCGNFFHDEKAAVFFYGKTTAACYFYTQGEGYSDAGTIKKTSI